MPAEEAHFINTKQLKFLLARSRWQVGSPFRGRGGDPNLAEGTNLLRPGSLCQAGLLHDPGFSWVRQVVGQSNRAVGVESPDVLGDPSESTLPPAITSHPN